MLPMEAKCYFDLGLATEREACTVLRKSRFMLANSFLVGTRFNSSRFSLASILALAFEAPLFFRSVLGTASLVLLPVHITGGLVSLTVRLTLDPRAR
jgi:hypothetical protein